MLILDGVFSDEHGDYPTGTYLASTWVRFPDGSDYNPHSAKGALLFVKRGYLPPA